MWVKNVFVLNFPIQSTSCLSILPLIIATWHRRVNAKVWCFLSGCSVEASIVRVMKSRRTLNHNQLISEVLIKIGVCADSICFFSGDVRCVCLACLWIFLQVFVMESTNILFSELTQAYFMECLRKNSSSNTHNARSFKYQSGAKISGFHAQKCAVHGVHGVGSHATTSTVKYSRSRARVHDSSYCQYNAF